MFDLFGDDPALKLRAEFFQTSLWGFHQHGPPQGLVQASDTLDPGED